MVTRRVIRFIRWVWSLQVHLLWTIETSTVNLYALKLAKNAYLILIMCFLV